MAKNVLIKNVGCKPQIKIIDQKRYQQDTLKP